MGIVYPISRIIVYNFNSFSDSAVRPADSLGARHDRGRRHRRPPRDRNRCWAACLDDAAYGRPSSSLGHAAAVPKPHPASANPHRRAARQQQDRHPTDLQASPRQGSPNLRKSGEGRTLRKPRGRAGAAAEPGVERRLGSMTHDSGYLRLTRIVRCAQLVQHRVATTPSAFGLLRRRQLVRLAQQAAGATLLGSPSLVIRHTTTTIVDICLRVPAGCG